MALTDLIENHTNIRWEGKDNQSPFKGVSVYVRYSIPLIEHQCIPPKVPSTSLSIMRSSISLPSEGSGEMIEMHRYIYADVRLPFPFPNYTLCIVRTANTLIPAFDIYTPRFIIKSRYKMSIFGGSTPGGLGGLGGLGGGGSEAPTAASMLEQAAKAELSKNLGKNLGPFIMG